MVIKMKLIRMEEDGSATAQMWEDTGSTYVEPKVAETVNIPPSSDFNRSVIANLQKDAARQKGDEANN